MDWVERVALTSVDSNKSGEPDVCIIEVSVLFFKHIRQRWVIEQSTITIGKTIGNRNSIDWVKNF